MNKLVLQPNGKYARWSDFPEHFTHYNLEKDEAYIIMLFGLGESDEGIWDECLEKIEKSHNLDERERAERFGNES